MVREKNIHNRTRADRTKEEDFSMDAQFMEQLREGDTAAFCSFYRRHGKPLYSYIHYHIGGNHQDAEEILQETLLGVARSVNSFLGKSRLSSWVYAIARHKISDFRRQRHNQHFSIPLHHVPEWHEIVDEEALPEEIMQRQESRNFIRDILSSLPRHYRQTLTLRYGESMSVKEIASIMGRSVKATESILHRARNAFRRALNDEKDFWDEVNPRNSL